MRLKPKTVRRLLLLALVLTLAVGAGVAMVVVRKSRTEARLVARRDAGLKAAADGNHRETVIQLGSYLKRRPSDAEALLAFARARQHVEDRSGRHMLESVSVYQRYLGLRDNDQEVRREFLRCLARAGMDVEVCDVAKRLRPADLAAVTAADVEVIRLEVEARHRRRQVDAETLALAQRAIEVAPDDFGLRIQYIILLASSRLEREIDDFLTQSAAAFPGDPRVRVLSLVASRTTEGAANEGLLTLCAVAGLDSKTATRTGPPLDSSDLMLTVLTSGFDGLGRPDLSLAVLEERAVGGDAELVRVFARRSVYVGRLARLVELQHERAAQPAWADNEVIIFTALALHGMGRVPESEAMFAELEKRPPDFRTQSWRAAYPVVLGTRPVEPLEAVKILRGALEENPQEPVIRITLAEQLLSLVRPEDARTEIDAAEKSQLTNGWARPGVLRARTLLAEDRLTEAAKECYEAARRFPADQVATATLLAIRVEMLDRGFPDAASPATFATQLGPTLDLLSGPEGDSMPPDLRATLLVGAAVAADRSDNPELVRRALDLAGASDSPLSVQSLMRLVGISRRRGLGLEEALVARAEQAGTTPASVFVRARLMALDSKRDAAIELVKAERESTPARQADPQWRVLLPCLLEDLADSGAVAEWKTVIDRYPDDVEVLRVAIQSRALAAEPEIIGRVADRLDTVSGVAGGRSPIVVRLARARATAAQKPTGTARDQALGILRGITTEAPDLVEPHLLLADLLLGETAPSVQDLNEAIQQLRAAIPLAPNPTPVRLQLADVLRLKGDSTAALAELASIAADKDAELDQRWRAVDSLAAMGAFDRAASAGRALMPSVGDPPSVPRSMTLSRVLLLAGQDADALSVLTSLAAKASEVTAEEAFSIANDLASLGRADAAEQMLSRLEKMPGREHEIRLVRARFDAVSGNSARSRAALLDVTREDPRDMVAWRLLAESFVTEGDLESAGRTIEEARANGTDPDLELLAIQVSFRSGETSVDSLLRLADQLEKKNEPEYTERAAAIRGYAALRAGGHTPTPDELRVVADRFAAEPTVQSVIVNDLMRTTPPAIAVASDVSTRAFRRFPVNWQTAADFVKVHRRRGDWVQMLEGAERWQRLNRSLAADLAVAEAQLQLKRPRQARTVVERHVASARAKPDDSLATLVLWAAILIAEGEHAEASRFLDPLMKSSPAVLAQVWAPIAARDVPADQAPAWLEAAEGPAAEQGDASVRAVADAWFVLASRDQTRRAGHLARARKLLEQLIARNQSGETLVVLGQVAGEMGDLDRAESAFRAAADFPSTSSQGLRGLAQVMLVRNADPAVIIETARRAVAAAPTPDAGCLVMLGDALIAAAARAPTPDAAAAHWREAAETYERAIALTGDEVSLVNRLLQCYEAQKDSAKAIATLERVLALGPNVISPRDFAAAQNNLAFALLSHEPTPATLQRARDLAAAAAKGLPVGAVFDTLGAAESAVGNRSAAIAAFRLSLADRSDSPSTLALLAELLATGSAAEKDEAKQLLAAAEAAISQNAEVDAPTLDRLNRVKKTLSPSSR